MPKPKPGQEEPETQQPKPDQKPATKDTQPQKKAEAQPKLKPSGAVIQGRKVAPEASQADVLPMKASEYPRFLLIYRPERMEYFGQCDRVLPVFSNLKLVPGVGRVSAKGSPDMALVEVQKSGGKVILEREISGGYIREYDMLPITPEHPKGVAGYLPKWDQIRRSGKIVKVERDWEAYSKFYEELLTQGLIQPPDVLVLEALQDKYRTLIRLADNRIQTGSDKAKVERDFYMKALNCIERTIQKLQDQTDQGQTSTPIVGD